MALRKKDQADKPVKEAPAQDQGTVEEPKTEAPAEETPTKEVAKKKQSAPPTTAPVTTGVFIQNPAMVEAATGAEYGDFPSITASNGSCMLRTTTTKEDIGKAIQFHAILARDVWKVSPGETDDDAKDYFKVSYDGEVCADGTPVQDALSDAIEAGYDKAKISQGVDVVILITKCDNAPDQVGEIRTLQLAPSSRRNWAPLARSVAMKSAMGKLKAVPIFKGSEDQAVLFQATAAAASWNGKDYTLFLFDLVE